MAGELLRARHDAPWLRWTIVAAGVLQITALLLFFANMWSRIRGLGSVGREGAGERF